MKGKRVDDYVGLAVYAFKVRAGKAFIRLCELGLEQDWRQEIELAALVCQQQKLGMAEAVRLMGRLAYRALREMGFWTVQGQGYTLRPYG